MKSKRAHILLAFIYLFIFFGGGGGGGGGGGIVVYHLPIIKSKEDMLQTIVAQQILKNHSVKQPFTS